MDYLCNCSEYTADNQPNPDCPSCCGTGTILPSGKNIEGSVTNRDIEIFGSKDKPMKSWFNKNLAHDLVCSVCNQKIVDGICGCSIDAIVPIS